MDTKDEGALYLLIGEMKAGINHILAAVTQHRKDIEHLEDRLTKVERFNWKVLGIASVLLPTLSISIPVVLKNYGLL